jgi:TonB family protein
MFPARPISVLLLFLVSSLLTGCVSGTAPEIVITGPTASAAPAASASLPIVRTPAAQKDETRNSSFKEYDERMVATVHHSWRALLDGTRRSDQTGTVVVKFLLHSDGTVSDLRTISSEVAKALSIRCEAAILAVQSFGRWPGPNIRKGAREITFTFHYQ